MKRTLVTLTTLALIAIASPMFAAGTATAPLAISANVAQNCTISTLPLAFGTYDTVAGTAVAGTATVSVACTKGSIGLTIDLDKGLNFASAVGTNRAMLVGGVYMNYDLYQDAGHSSVWLNAVTPASIAGAAPSKAPRTFTVYGLIAANQDVPAGTYVDTVTATVNY